MRPPAVADSRIRANVPRMMASIVFADVRNGVFESDRKFRRNSSLNLPRSVKDCQPHDLVSQTVSLPCIFAFNTHRAEVAFHDAIIRSFLHVAELSGTIWRPT